VTDMPPPTPAPPATPTPPSPFNDERQMPLIIYILYLAAFATGITAIVGVVLAYVNKDSAPEWLQSHYRFQIYTFWIGILFMVASTVLVFVVIGVFLWIATIVWYVVRCAMGLNYLLKTEAYPRPTTWMV
jgi:uncharacterized membrane protein